MENFNQFADRIRLRFRCVNCEQTIEQEFNVPAPHLDRGDNSADTENTSEEHCLCSNCRHGYNVDITTNELDGVVVVHDERYTEIETISAQSIFDDEDPIQPSHTIVIRKVPQNQLEEEYKRVYTLCKQSIENNVLPTIEFEDYKVITIECSKSLFGKLLIENKVPILTCNKLGNDYDAITNLFIGIQQAFIDQYPEGILDKLRRGIYIKVPQVEITGGGDWKIIQIDNETRSLMNEVHA